MSEGERHSHRIITAKEGCDAMLSTGGSLREAGLGSVCPDGVALPVGSNRGVAKFGKKMVETASVDKNHEIFVGANCRHGKPARARGRSGIVVCAGESHDSFTCTSKRHGKLGKLVSVCDCLDGAPRAGCASAGCA